MLMADKHLKAVQFVPMVSICIQMRCQQFAIAPPGVAFVLKHHAYARVPFEFDAQILVRTLQMHHACTFSFEAG